MYVIPAADLNNELLRTQRRRQLDPGPAVPGEVDRRGVLLPGPLQIELGFVVRLRDHHPLDLEGAQSEVIRAI